MPRHKAKQADDDSVTDSVLESPPKKAKAAPALPPRMSRGPYQAAQEANKKAEKKKGKEKKKEQAQAQKQDALVPKADPSTTTTSVSTVRSSPLPSLEDINREYEERRKKNQPKPPPAPIDPTIRMPSLIEIDIDAYNNLDKDRHITNDSGTRFSPTQHRQSCLRGLYYTLGRTGDPYDDLPNIVALLHAYRCRRMVYQEGRVTYWYKGVCIGGPGEYDAEEHKRLAQAQEEPRKVWVEGLNVSFYLCLRM